MTRSTTKNPQKIIENLTHGKARRKNLPSAEQQPFVDKSQQGPIPVKFQRNPDLDPQLVWRDKYKNEWQADRDNATDHEFTVNAPPLYVQEKVHPRVLIEDLKNQTELRQNQQSQPMLDFYSDFNGLPSPNARTEFYQHDQHWSNRMILGDSLQVMASLTEREGLRGSVQCIYFDPPYGIKFNSNFQWSTTSRDVKDGNTAHITREPEQVKAFRDTWRDGIHSYLTYLRDRLLVAQDLLHESGSILVQIGDENVHRVRAVMDEIFGEDNFVSQITSRKTTSEGATLIGSVVDHILWFAKNKDKIKYRPLLMPRSEAAEGRYSSSYLDGRTFRLDNITSSRPAGEGDTTEFLWLNKRFTPGKGTFKTNLVGLEKLAKSDRLVTTRTGQLSYRRFQDDFGYAAMSNLWSDISGAVQSRTDPKIYVVQTSTSLIQRCLLMTTDPGDLVLDPTCGSGTTVYVAEQWGRRWITIDTSRVALALARARIMGARYPYYLLADSEDGQKKEAEITRTMPIRTSTGNDVRQGFVYERVPHITLKSIANNAEIDVIWDKWQESLEPLRAQLNAVLGKDWQEWEIPREAGEDWDAEAIKAHGAWWEARIARQQEIDASIAAKAEFEHLYDKPYTDNKKVRVAGPFTVESVLPHRTLNVDEDGELIDPSERPEMQERHSFAQMVLEQLRMAGVQQADKSGRIAFSSLESWPGEFISAEGIYEEGEGATAKPKRAAILIGPEFGTIQRADLVDAAREATTAGFDLLIACGFAFEAQTTDLSRIGAFPVLKARMNADLHMGGELKANGAGNLFVVFGEPDIELLYPAGDQVQVQIRGVDVFHPATGEVRSSDAEDIACWFIDTNYDSESFFVRQAYFLGANDPYGALKTTLKAEIDEEAWSSLNSAISRPFPKPSTGRIAVKVINHLGDEVMKVYRITT